MARHVLTATALKEKKKGSLLTIRPCRKCHREPVGWWRRGGTRIQRLLLRHPLPSAIGRHGEIPVYVFLRWRWPRLEVEIEPRGQTVYERSAGDDKVNGDGELEKIVVGAGVKVERFRRTRGGYKAGRWEHADDGLG